MGNDADTAEVEAEHTLAAIVNAEAKSDHLVDETALFADMARRSFEAALQLTETPNKWSSPRRIAYRFCR